MVMLNALVLLLDLLGVTWPIQVVVAPSGREAVFVRRTVDLAGNRWKTNLWRWRFADAKAPVALTHGDANSGPAYSPDGRTLAFTSTRGGAAQLWLLPLTGGEARQLTTLSTGASGAHWSPDGKHLAFVSSVFPDCKDDACNAERALQRKKSMVSGRVYDSLLFRHWNHWRGKQRSHLFVVPADASAPPRDVTPGPHDAPPLALGGSRDYDFSPDGTRLAYVKNVSPVVATSTNNDVFEVGVDGQNERQLTAHPGNDHSPRYAPDGKSLAYLSMARAGYEADRQRILVRELATGTEVEWGKDVAQPHDLVWAKDSATIYFTTPLAGKVEVFAATAAGAQQVSKGRYAKYLNVAGAGADARLVFTDEAANRPPEVVVQPLAGPGTMAAEGALTTALNAQAASRVQVPPAEHHTFEGAGGAKIHALLVKPPGFTEGKKYPAMLMLHGGPQGMTGDDFHPRWNLANFAAMGYVVFGINFHGSTGFGQAFTDAIRADWGGKPFEDVLKGTEYLAKLPFVDGKKICAAGASYGGYLVNWIATHSERFACLISHAGVYNLESKWGSTEELWFPEWEMKGTPYTARARYRKWSPSSYAENLKTPTLVVHGAKDFRVPLEQGLQMFTALQRQSVPSQLLFFPDEDHWVQKPRNIELWWRTVGDWLKRHLGGGDAPKSEK